MSYKLRGRCQTMSDNIGGTMYVYKKQIIYSTTRRSSFVYDRKAERATIFTRFGLLKLLTKTISQENHDTLIYAVL